MKTEHARVIAEMEVYNNLSDQESILDDEKQGEQLIFDDLLKACSIERKKVSMWLAYRSQHWQEGSADFQKFTVHHHSNKCCSRSQC